MNEEDRQELMRALAVFVKERVEQACAPLRQRIAELESKGIEYVGTFQRAMGYRRGQCVTFDGSMYVCIADVAPGADQPGSGKSWQLALKRGNDGKDANWVPTRSATRVG